MSRPLDPARLAPWIVASATALAFGNAAPDALVYDDGYFLPIPRAANESILDVIGRLFAGNVWSSRRMGLEAYRPVTFATQALDGALYGGWRGGYHLTSIVLHVAVTVLFYFAVRALLEPRSVGVPAWLAAAGAAIVFGVHPIHTEAVDSAFNRGDLLVALCTLAAVAALWRFEPARPALGWGLAAGAYLVALFCKETAVAVPALALAILAPLRVHGAWREQVRRLAPVALLAVPLVIFLAVRHTVMASTTWSSETLYTTWEAIVLTPAAFRDSLAMVLWPHPLKAVRTDYVASAVPLALVVIAGYAAAVVAGWRRAPGVAAGLSFFAVALLPSLPLVTYLANAQVIAERYLYVPSIGLAVALAFGLAALGGRAGAGAVVGASALAAAVLLPLTVARNQDWHSAIALFEAEVATSPSNPEAVLNLGMAYASAGRSQESLALCERYATWQGIGLERFFMNCGIQLETRGDLVGAERHFRRGAGGDAPAPAYYAYGRLLARLGRRDEAEVQYRRALEISRDPVREHTIRAEMLFKLHPDRLADAQAEIDAALALDPSFEMAANLRRRIVGARSGAAGQAEVAAPAEPLPEANLAAKPPAPATAPTSNVGAPAFDARTTETILAGLHEAPAGSPVWIVARADDDTARARADALGRIFTRAGWMVRALTQTRVAVKPGIFVFAADEQPPAYVYTASRALEQAGLGSKLATGYRAFYDEMSRTRPGFVGFELAPDQAWVIVVSRLQ